MTDIEEDKVTYSFGNGFREAWVFEYEVAKDKGILKGSDVGWNEYPVIEGRVLDLTLDTDEETRLMSVWKEATKLREDQGIYLGRDTELKIDRAGCWLTNDYCPVCLVQKKEFDRHHCIWSCNGGTEDYFNMLKVCKTLHAILTYGSVEDRVSRDLAAFYHQIMHFGLEFFPRNNLRKKKYKDRHFLELNPRWKHILDRFDALSKVAQDEEDTYIKETAKLKYQYFRDMGTGKWSWDDRERLVRE